MFSHYLTLTALTIGGIAVAVYVPDQQPYGVMAALLFGGMLIGSILTEVRMNAIRAAKRAARLAREQ